MANIKIELDHDDLEKVVLEYINNKYNTDFTKVNFGAYKQDYDYYGTSSYYVISAEVSE